MPLFDLDAERPFYRKFISPEKKHFGVLTYSAICVYIRVHGEKVTPEIGVPVNDCNERKAIMRNRIIMMCVVALTCVATLSAMGANMLTNSGFNVDMSGWHTFDEHGGQVGRATDQTYEGTGSLQFATASNASRQQYDVVNDPLIEATPGVQYDLKGNYYTDSKLLDDEAIGIGLFWWKLNANEDWVECDTSGDFSTVYGPDTSEGYDTGQEVVETWTQITDSQTAPNDAEYLQVALQVMGRGSTVYFDDFEVVPEPATAALLALTIGAIAIFRKRYIKRKDN